MSVGQKLIKTLSSFSKTVAKILIRVPLSTRPNPNAASPRIHVDFAGPINGNYCVDTKQIRKRDSSKKDSDETIMFLVSPIRKVLPSYRSTSKFEHPRKIRSAK